VGFELFFQDLESFSVKPRSNNSKNPEAYIGVLASEQDALVEPAGLLRNGDDLAQIVVSVIIVKFATGRAVVVSFEYRCQSRNGSKHEDGVEV
jgi:hypothetical protein